MRTVFAFAVTLLIVPVIVGCAAAPTPVPPTAIPSATSVPPTATPVPPSATLVPLTATFVPPTAPPPPTKLPPPTPQFSVIKEPVTEAELRCIESGIGVQATADLRQKKRNATDAEVIAVDKCRTGGDNPSNHEVYVTTSADGLNWTPGTLLSKTASVPAVIRTSKGILWACWVDFANVTGPNRARIGVAKSSDGSAWEKMGFVQFTGLGQIAAADPDVIELADGRLRMYVSDGIPAPDNRKSIYSAISNDGINYTLESGVRFQAENVTDPNVIQLPDGRYRMYMQRNGDIMSATSADGLAFTDDGGVRLQGGASPGAIVLSDGLVHLYANASDISVYKSKDGLAFDLEKPGVIRAAPGTIVADPTITKMPTGYLMVYKSSPSPLSGGLTLKQQTPQPPASPQVKPVGTPMPTPTFVPGPVRECIVQRIGAQAWMDIQQGTRVATPAEESAIRECLAPISASGATATPRAAGPIVTVTIPPVEDSAVLECIAQKIGPRAVYEIQQSVRSATPEEANAIRSCPLPKPTPPPPPGSGPAPGGRLVVINHRSQDAYMTLGGRAQRISKDGGRMDWGALAPGRQSFSLDLGGKGADCSQYNGCSVEIVVNKEITLDLW